VGALHFKYLHAHDAEAAYHEAIHHLVMQDGLTEIGNRRKLDEELNREFARATRHHRPLSMVLFDVDEFKGVNDTQGHLGGDHVLKRIASVCQRSLRPEQVFARVGGDEFAILSPETRLDGAIALAEKLRAAVAELAFDGDLVDPDLRVTCSFGCAEISGDMDVAGSLFDAADRALYHSKSAGRDRVSAAG
jgi:diguanylate cyclase (GGDEF)-like protein